MGDFLDHEENLAQEYNYSDKYRGFDYETVNKLPEEFILQQMKKCKDNIEYYKESLIKFGEML